MSEVVTPLIGISISSIALGSGVTLAVVLLVFRFLYMHPDKFEHWMEIFDRFLLRASSSIPRIRGKVDRRAVASSIQSVVNGICEKINNDAPDILPHALKIEWIQSESPEVFIKNGKAVVRLKHYVNQDRNIVDATLLYLNKDLLPQAKVYLDKTLHKSCEYKVATQVFAARRDTGAYAYFIENELNPTINTDADFKQDLQMLEDLDSVGFFTRVFLTEVKQTGEKLLGTMPTPAIKQELRNFAEFLQTIANKGSEEDVPLNFKGVKIRVAVVLVAKKETIQSYGAAPYINCISRLVREGYESIYISGWGEDFAKRIIEIKKHVEGNFVTILRRYDYPIREQVKGILLVCQSNLSYLSQQRKLQDELRDIITAHVPEIKNNEIEIVKLARIERIGSKVIVRWSDKDMNMNFMASQACRGRDGGQLKKIQQKLFGEQLYFHEWTEDPKELIIRCLYPLKRSDVFSIELDEENLIANVEVSNDEAYNEALGRDNYNVKLARELTEWFINIKELRQSENNLTSEDELKGIVTTHVPMPTPEDELRDIITAHVLEIKNNEIEIVRLARIERIGSRVVVRWSDKDVNVKFMASQACRGLDGGHLKKIQQELFGERLYFHEWRDDPKELIIGCLYPLKRSDVISINLNYEENKASITIKDIEKSPLLWSNQYNLTLSERVTGWSIEIKESPNT
jgi:transcription antitermination factor NusA-like protein